MKLPKLRIASELHQAPNWVALVPDDGRSAFYRSDVVLWVAATPNSHEVARAVIEAVNGLEQPTG